MSSSNPLFFGTAGDVAVAGLAGVLTSGPLRGQSVEFAMDWSAFVDSTGRLIGVKSLV
jgi:hypothetical protein